jgi:UDP-N-acetylmuramoyl-L-alanyl-D-glutamate--2,6-diaminopimelate ligase
MGALADRYCDIIVLTNEDPYDEDPKKIIDEVATGLSNHTPFIIFDRRAAIATALKEAQPDDVVLITGKGTDPYIMGRNGSKFEWSDTRVAEEELRKLGYN